MDEFSRTALDEHNKLRSAHNVQPLSWSNDLSRSAQVWAKKLAKEGRLKHDRLEGIGENVFMSSQGFDVAAEEAVKSWYSEVMKRGAQSTGVRNVQSYGFEIAQAEKYNFKKGGHQPGTGHFTQVVWKDTKEFGMARAKSSNGSVFVVARYRPAGNILSAFNGNVLPKVAADKEHCQEKAPSRETSLAEEKSSCAILDDSFIATVLQAHNELRMRHNVPSLRWSPALSRDAQAWAEKLSSNGELRHASKEERKCNGENVCRMSDHFDVSDAVKMWYSEIKTYDYDTPGFSIDTGHFTQIVWRNTAEIGVGSCKSLDGNLTYLVARYYPPGNVLERFHENVTAVKQ